MNDTRPVALGAPATYVSRLGRRLKVYQKAALLHDSTRELRDRGFGDPRPQ
ncbi:MAG: hypothetical protein LH624_16940 [Cryobacterium sp.]|nr:hypothetical protein [Cryobacterium sp.]